MALEDRYAPLAQHLRLGFVIIHTDNLVAHLGKTDSGNKPNVSGPDHTDGNWL